MYIVYFLGTTSRVSVNQEQVIVEGECESNQNYDKCMDTSLHQLLQEEINCTVPWVSHNRNICKVQLPSSHLISA